MDGHVHLRMALHPSDRPAAALLAGLVDEAPAQERAKEESEDDDHQRAADELSEHELPAEEQPDDDPELDHEVRGGEHEGHR